MENSHKTLYKSDDQKLVSGVCGGIAEFLGVDPSPIRVIFMLLLFANGIGFIIYIIFALILPAEHVVNEQEDEAFFEGAYALRRQAEAEAKNKPASITPPAKWKTILRAANIAGVLVIVSAVVLLAQEIVPWYLVGTQARIPLLAMGIGLAIIVRSKRV
jgi:phage shock protein C